MNAKPTHIRLKTGQKVNVTRHQGNVLVVKNMKGKVLGSYDPATMDKFSKRYKSLLGKRQSE